MAKPVEIVVAMVMAGVAVLFVALLTGCAGDRGESNQDTAGGPRQPGDCIDDLDCIAGEVCDADTKRCLEVAMIDSDDTSDNHVATTGGVNDPCTRESDCGPGLRCQENLGLCTRPDGACGNNSDCRGGEVCQDGHCRAIEDVIEGDDDADAAQGEDSVSSDDDGALSDTEDDTSADDDSSVDDDQLSDDDASSGDPATDTLCADYSQCKQTSSMYLGCIAGHCAPCTTDSDCSNEFAKFHCSGDGLCVQCRSSADCWQGSHCEPQALECVSDPVSPGGGCNVDGDCETGAMCVAEPLLYADSTCLVPCADNGTCPNDEPCTFLPSKNKAGCLAGYFHAALGADCSSAVAVCAPDTICVTASDGTSCRASCTDTGSCGASTYCTPLVNANGQMTGESACLPIDCAAYLQCLSDQVVPATSGAMCPVLESLLKTLDWCDQVFMCKGDDCKKCVENESPLCTVLSDEVRYCAGHCADTCGQCGACLIADKNNLRKYACYN